MPNISFIFQGDANHAIRIYGEDVVDQSIHGQISEEALEEKVARQYLGGQGIGAKILFDRQKGNVDALGPENILGS
jgi:hypothetical protein